MFFRTAHNDNGASRKECRFWEKKNYFPNTKHVPYIHLAGFITLLIMRTHTHKAVLN